MADILVVDDDKSILEVLRMRLESRGYTVSTATRPDRALQIARTSNIDLALVDLKLDGASGIDVMEALHAIIPDLSVIILTAYGTIQSAVEAIKRGADSYLTKPFDYQALLLQTETLLEKTHLGREVKRLKRLVKERFGFDNIIGKSDAMQRVMEQVGLAAESDSNVYIEGESGTGKELIANTLHLASTRAQGPFVPVNCAAIPETLLESELFGYEKGAFTGALRNQQGLFAQADKGTFFLDEISEMPPSMQAKFLRLLQEKTFFAVGGRRPIQIDARLIASSNRDLAAEVAAGRFREDLYYRIHVVLIRLPPLRQRTEDIPLLADFFLKKYNRAAGKRIEAFSIGAIKRMLQHDWPGNVRELENTVEGAVAMTTRKIIGEDLILPAQRMAGPGLQSYKHAKQNFEKSYLAQLLETTRGNISQAAKLAGKYRADLYDLFKKYELDPKTYRQK